MQSGNKSMRGAQAFGLWVVVALAGAMFHYSTGWSLIHELSHAGMAILTGGRVIRLGLDSVTIAGYTDEVLYAGIFGGVLFRAIAIAWLMRSRRSYVLPAWIWGRLILEYLGWWISNGQDRALFSAAHVETYFTMIHLSLALGIVAAATIIAAIQGIMWWSNNPRHLLSPNPFRKGQLA